MNHCSFTGRLTADPERKEVGQNGASVTRFSLAVETYYGTQNGETKTDVDFLDFEAWSKTGDVINNHCKKGDQIIVEARAKKDTWKDKEDGTGRSKTYFKVTNFEFSQKKRQDNE